MTCLAAASAPFPATLAGFFGLPPIVPVCYCLGVSILLIGLIVAFRRDIPRAQGLDKIVCFGPVFFVAPLAVFAGEHFTVTRGMAGMVPGWIPWHMFWVIFVGLCLVAASLSLAVGRVAGLASFMLGVMFFGFVTLMDVEGLTTHLHDRFIWTLTFRELTFSLCSFAFAATLANARWRPASERLAAVARVVVGSVIVFYGVEHFLHPQFVPVIPLELPLPAYIPVHVLINFVVGGAEVLAGLAMVVNRQARTAATLLGALVGVVVLLVYLPLLIAHPADIEVAMNYVADTLCFGGAVLMLAGSIAPEQHERATVAGPVAVKLQNG